MRQQMVLLALFVCIGMIFEVETPTPALACSGSMQPLEGLLERSDVVVKAEVVEVDDFHVNAIVRVESYLVGGARGEYLAVAQVSQQEVQALLDGRGYCGLSSQRWHTGETRMMFLKRNDDGSYRPMTGGWDNDYLFEDETSIVETRHMTEDGTYAWIDVNESELVALIAETSGNNAHAPNRSDPYPLHAPILIRTVTGSAYIQPMDGTEPVLIGTNVNELQVVDRFLVSFPSGELQIIDRRNLQEPLDWRDLPENLDCSTFDCVQFAPHGSFVSFKLSNRTIQICNIEWVLHCEYEGQEPIILDGEAMLFAPSSDAIAIWNGDQIDLYRVIMDRDIVDAMLTTVALNAATLELDSEVTQTWTQEHSVWSPDGQRVAFADARGLWVWDVLTVDSTPQLIVPTDNNGLPTPMYFSSHGRYLAVEHNTHVYTLEIASGQELPYGVVSPDERLIAVYDAEDETETLSICHVIPFTCYPSVDFPQPNGHWVTASRYLTATCYPSYDFCIPALVLFPSFGYLHDFNVNPDGFQWFLGTQHQLEISGDNLLVLNDNTTLSIGYDLTTQNVFEPLDVQTIELSNALDSDIVSVEWLPSMFIQGSY